MRIRFPRVLALFFTLALIASPHAVLFAQEQVPDLAATPIMENQEGSDKDPGEIDDGNNPDADKENDDSNSLMGTSRRSMRAPAPDSNTWGVLQPAYDTATNELTIGVLFTDGFEATLDGRVTTFTISYDASVLTLSPATQLSLTDVPGSTVTVDPVAGIITVTFNDYFAVTGDSVVGTVTIPGSVTFEECVPSTEPYPSEAYIWFGLPNVSTEVGITVTGPECPALDGPTIAMAHYDAPTGMLLIGIINVSFDPIVDKQLTLTYPADKMTFEGKSFDVWGFSAIEGREYIVGTASASDGLITITFRDTGIEGEWLPIYISLPVGWLINNDCADVTDTQWVEVGALTFVSNHGQSFESYVPGMLCNAEPVSKTGTWSTTSDGEPAIDWTIDTGDVIGTTYVDDYLQDLSMNFDCDSLDVEVIRGHADFDDDCYEGDLYVELFGQDDESYRAIITITTPLDTEFPRTSYVNCAIVYAVSDSPRLMAAAQGSNGLGGQACYELFAPDVVGDTLTIDVDKTEAQVGDTLSYTLEVSTAADSWGSITLTNPLPAGFELDPDSVTCSVSPAELSGNPCYVLVDDVLTVNVYPILKDDAPESSPSEMYYSPPATITVTYSGVVTAEPGETLMNEASSIRRPWLGTGGIIMPMAMGVGDPTEVGGGLITAQAATLVQEPPSTETPTPSPTPTQTPSPTATATPTGTVAPSPTSTATGTPDDPPATVTPSATPATPDGGDAAPTATSPVTGLPSTGSNGPSAASAIFVAAIASAVLLVAGVALHLRPRE